MAPKAPYLPSGTVLHTSRGRSPQPACKAKPITGRTLGAQGQRPGGAINPHARKGRRAFGNTGKHRLNPDPNRRPYPRVFFIFLINRSTIRPYRSSGWVSEALSLLSSLEAMRLPVLVSYHSKVTVTSA